MLGLGREALGELVAWMLAMPTFLMLAWFAAELTCGLRRARSAPPEETPLAGWPTIIVPAHDEALGIGAMLTDLLAKVPATSVLVIADNCSDDTAAVARANGVKVVERTDPDRRGKGYALAFGRDVLAADPPASVMILDADCRIERGDPRVLAQRAARRNSVGQAENVQVAEPGAAPTVQIGAFAFLVMNLLRARGMERLAGGAFLQGTGMVFSWPVFERLRLATANAVEDIELTHQLARMEIPVRLDPRCRVTSRSADRAGHFEQRTRWERGFVRSMRQGLLLLGDGVSAGCHLRCGVAAHMLVPPLALLSLTAAAILAAVCAMAWLDWSSWIPAASLASAGMSAAVAILAAWFVSRRVLPFRTLLRAPLYVLWKLPIYLGLLRGGEPRWTRTQRAKGVDPS